jgi:hypothetical protein
MNIIFQINGGIGKCILATPVCEAIKSQHPNSQLIVMSGYPEVFLNNPFVDRSFAFGQAQYFYQDFIEGKDFKVFAHDPYLQTEYLMQNEHLVQTWTNMFDINTPEDILPKLYITERERIFFSQKFYSDRPILLLQTNGGAQGQDLKYSWARDIPSNVVQSVIEEFKNQYNIVHMRREDQIGYEGTLTISDNFRALAVLIELSSKRLLMDSFGHHAAAALNKPSTVLWVANTPVVFGHDIHDNIVANPLTKKPELKHSYIQKFDITGNLLEFPYNSESEIFDVDKVIASIKNQN